MSVAGAVTILAIDDEKQVRQLLRSYLEASGFLVLEAADAPSGLEAVRQHDPDLVLLDLRMPGTDGLDILPVIHAERPDTPVIVVSGAGLISDAIEALRNGAWDFLVKPVERLAILQHAVERALERARLRRENRVYRQHLEEQVAERTRQLTEANAELRREMDARTSAEERLRGYQVRLSLLADQLDRAAERERRQIAEGLHDQVGATLALCRMRIEALGERCSGDVAEEMAHVRALIEETIEYTRTLTFQLSPPLLYEVGFEAAVKRLAETIGRRHDVAARFRDDGEPKPLGEGVRGVLFQAVREAVVNVVKHARASSMCVAVGRDADSVVVEVSDDGVGFDADQATALGEGFGLFCMRERLAHLQGQCHIESAPGEGTRIVLTVPVTGQGPGEEGKDRWP